MTTDKPHLHSKGVAITTKAVVEFCFVIVGVLVDCVGGIRSFEHLVWVAIGLMAIGVIVKFVDMKERAAHLGIR